MRCVECDESFNRSEVERNRCPHCDAKLPAANAPPRKKMKKGQPQSWFAAKRKWVLALAGGRVALWKSRIRIDFSLGDTCSFAC